MHGTKPVPLLSVLAAFNKCFKPLSPMGVGDFGRDHPEFILAQPQCWWGEKCMFTSWLIASELIRGQSAMAQYYQLSPQDGIHQLKTKFTVFAKLTKIEMD